MCRLGISRVGGALTTDNRNNIGRSGATTKSVVRGIYLIVAVLLFTGLRYDGYAASPITFEAEGFFCRVDDIIARPSGAKSHQFVLINLGIEVVDRQDIDSLIRQEQRIRAIAQNLIAQRSIKDLSAPNGKRSLRYALRNRINALLPHGNLTHIYFIDYVVQTRR